MLLSAELPGIAKSLHDKPLLQFRFLSLYHLYPFFFSGFAALVFPELASQGARFVVLQYNKRWRMYLNYSATKKSINSFLLFILP